ncbi:broad substrate specificity ATP-binding cassette transporter ABCG2-like, partial [Anneissia japonica]|uniref:broad substrate specificity ATP-binding cassette transporter ABCG2-like n=1 Tax=Anneissia japonica TaxID=1529436 RepID=UPI0014259152
LHLHSDICIADDVEGGELPENEVGNSLAEQYIGSSYHADTKKELSLLWTNHKDSEDVAQRKIEYQSSFLKQMSVVSRRAILNLIRNPAAARMQMIMMTFLALIVGVIYFDVDDSITSGIQN